MKNPISNIWVVTVGLADLVSVRLVLNNTTDSLLKIDMDVWFTEWTILMKVCTLSMEYYTDSLPF